MSSKKSRSQQLKDRLSKLKQEKEKATADKLAAARKEKETQDKISQTQAEYALALLEENQMEVEDLEELLQPQPTTFEGGE